MAVKIQEFNASFNRQYASEPHQIYFYGIDRGNAELATLALVAKFTKNQNEFKQPIPEFTQFSVYRLKDECLDYTEEYLSNGRSKQRHAIKNLSYFIDNNDEIFEQEEVASIDLTTAKLIKGKIVENGDVLSYLRLKELSAKRRIYEYFSQSNLDLNKPSILYFQEDNFYVHTLDSNPRAIVYYYRPDLKKIASKDSIEKVLNEYLKQLQIKNKERDILTIEKINHLRDALAANMVGIMAHLFQQYPGIIALENLSENQLASHFLASNENISRRLEWRLYNKFQNLGLVPPRLKESILLRQDGNINQFGAIHYIPAENTSKKCPNCGENNTKKGADWDKDKYEKRLYECTNNQCKFNTKTNRKDLESLNNPDIVASYNIAMRGFEYVLSPPKLKPQLRSLARQGKANNNTHQLKKQQIRSSQRAINKPFVGLRDKMNKAKK